MKPFWTDEDRDNLTRLFTDDPGLVETIEKVCGIEYAADADRLVNTINSAGGIPNPNYAATLAGRMRAFRELVALLREYMKKERDEEESEA